MDLIGHNLPLFFGLIGAVVVIAALLSGFIEKSSFPQVAVFLGLGAIVGPHGLGLLDVGLNSSMLHLIGTLSLSLVLFTDALTIDLKEVRKHAGLAALILGPGTIIAAGLIAAAAMWLLKLPLPLAAILAAPLASTDPVILRGLLKRSDLPSAARQALRLESGLNDVVLLPIILVAMAFALPAAGHGVDAGQLLLRMLIIGPGAGAAVAWVSITLLEKMRKRVGVRRDYESLYSIGIALAAFAAAESLHGSGYLAVFAAGLMIASLDTELCDCFREYGETTAEIMLLFTFVLLGASLIWVGISTATLAVAAFVLLALIARPLTLAAALWRTRTDRAAKRMIIWYGPRGLSTLLLILVPIFAEVPNTEPLFHVATVVVLVSVMVHGGSIMFFGRHVQRTPETVPLRITESQTAPILPEAMTPEQIVQLRESEAEVWLADARQESDYLTTSVVFEGSVRAHPQFARRDIERAGLPKTAPIAVFCACPDDATAERVTSELRSAGWIGAFTVRGGWQALQDAEFPQTNKTP